MKRLAALTCFMLFGFFVLTGCYQPGKVPPEVQSALEAKYPGIVDPNWQIDRNGNFETHFKKGGKKYRADFSPDGRWIETERSIKKKELPAAVKEAIEKAFKNIKIVELEWVDHAQKGIFYDVEFIQAGQKFDVEFNAEGRIIGGED